MKIVINRQAMLRFGARCVQIIFERTSEGIDKDGNAFKEYSTRPFAMPVGAITKRSRTILSKNGQLTYFKRGGKLWVVVKNGYLGLKKANFSKTDYKGNVNLQNTGAMFQNFDVIEAGNNRVQLGFTNPESAKIAKYNIDKGRDFLGLSDKDMEDPVLQQAIADGLIIQI